MNDLFSLPDIGAGDGTDVDAEDGTAEKVIVLNDSGGEGSAVGADSIVEVLKTEYSCIPGMYFLLGYCIQGVC